VGISRRGTGEKNVPAEWAVGRGKKKTFSSPSLRKKKKKKKEIGEMYAPSCPEKRKGERGDSQLIGQFPTKRKKRKTSVPHFPIWGPGNRERKRGGRGNTGLLPQ